MPAQKLSSLDQAVLLVGFFAVLLTIISAVTIAASFVGGKSDFTDTNPAVSARAAYNYGFDNSSTNKATQELIELLKDTRQTSFVVKVWEGSAPPPPELKIEPLGPGVHYYSEEVVKTTPAAEAAKALNRVTNQNFGQNYDQWANWFYNQGHNQPTGSDRVIDYVTHAPIVTIPLIILVLLYRYKPWKKKK